MRQRGRPKTPVRRPGQVGRLQGQKNKKHGMDLRRAIYHVVRIYEPEFSIKKSAMDVMNSIIIDIMKGLQKEAVEIMELGKSKLMQSNTLAAAVKLKFPGTIAEFADKSGQKAVRKYKRWTKDGDNDWSEGPSEPQD